MNTIGSYAPDFEIPGIDKEVYHLGSYRRQFKAIAVVFMDRTEATDRYIERLKQIQTDFAERKFTIIGIDSNHYLESNAESIEAMKQYAKDKAINFPYLRDSNQDVARGFKAKIAPTVYLLDSGGVVCYQGRIDDAESETEVKHHYLRDSITAMLDGKSIDREYVAPVGAEIALKSA